MALAWPNHIHHGAARTWFRRIRDTGWATCPLTESGFIRVSSNQRVIPEARAPAEALALLRAVRAVPGHHFWTDEVTPAEDPAGAFRRVVGYRQVTDAHLLTLAHHHGGCLATFDRGLEELAGPELGDHVERITPV